LMPVSPVIPDLSMLSSGVLSQTCVQVRTYCQEYFRQQKYITPFDNYRKKMVRYIQRQVNILIIVC
jgi:hypothetical protein